MTPAVSTTLFFVSKQWVYAEAVQDGQDMILPLSVQRIFYCSGNDILAEDSRQAALWNIAFINGTIKAYNSLTMQAGMCAVFICK